MCRARVVLTRMALTRVALTIMATVVVMMILREAPQRRLARVQHRVEHHGGQARHAAQGIAPFTTSRTCVPPPPAVFYLRRGCQLQVSWHSGQAGACVHCVRQTR